MTPEQQATAHRKSVEHVHQQIEAEHQSAAWRAQVPERLLRLLITAQQVSGVSITTAMTDTNVFVSFMYNYGGSLHTELLDYSSSKQDFMIVEDALREFAQ